MTGSSMANTAMLGSLMVPEMQRRGYNWRMSLGPILGTGGLAMIIPPSNLGVLLASVASIDVGRLLVSGVVPGFVLALLYSGMIFTQVRLNPSSAPIYDVEPSSARQKIKSVAVDILPMSLVVFMVIGSIIFGIATPSEASAFGVLGVLILAAVFRLLTLESIKKSLESTIKVGGMVFFIIINSSVFSQLVAYSGASSGLLGWVTSFDLSVTVMLLCMFVVLLLLGMFMDPVSMILISVPIFLPIVSYLKVDPVWFGLFTLLALEMSQTTPPFGLLLYIMLGVAPKGGGRRGFSIPDLRRDPGCPADDVSGDRALPSEPDAVAELDRTGRDVRPRVKPASSPRPYKGAHPAAGMESRHLRRRIAPSPFA